MRSHNIEHETRRNVRVWRNKGKDEGTCSAAGMRDQSCNLILPAAAALDGQLFTKWHFGTHICFVYN